MLNPSILSIHLSKSFLKKSGIQPNGKTLFSIIERDFSIDDGFYQKRASEPTYPLKKNPESRIYSFIAKKLLSNLSQLSDF